MTFGVETETMASSTAKVGLAVEQIGDLLKKMRADIDEMLAGWAGAGADAHRDLHTRYEADVRAINTNLQEMQTALQQTHQLYVRQETEQHGDHITMRNEIV